MKKDIILSLRKLSLLLLFTGSLFSLSAAPTSAPDLGLKKSKATVKDDSTKVIFSNWLGEMVGLCVYLNADDKVEMTVNVVTKTSYIDPYPDVHYEYSFNNEPFSVSDKLVDTDFVYQEYNGQMVYVATFTHLMDYTDQCVTPETTLSIDYEIRLVTPTTSGDYDLYPVSSHIGTLFPDNTQLGSSGNAAITEMGDKVVCCDQKPEEGGETGPEVRRAAPQQGLSLVKITPNPFSNELSIESTLAENTMAIVRIFDVTGKIWYQEQLLVNAGRTTKQNISTAHFPPGLYFYKVNEETPVKLLKTE